MPRQNESYGDTGLKYHNFDGKKQPKNQFMTNVRINSNKDKGYYSDHTYESPLRDHGRTAGPGIVGYNMVNPEEIQTQFQERRNSNSDAHEDPILDTSSGMFSFPRGQEPGRVPSHLQN